MTKPLLKDLWKHWAEYTHVPEEALDKWVADPNRIWHCVFCGRHGYLDPDFTISDLDLQIHLDKQKVDGARIAQISITACPVCREYKGVEPCIPEYCECEYLDVVRKLMEANNDQAEATPT